MPRKKVSHDRFMKLRAEFAGSIDWPKYKSSNVNCEAFSNYCRNRKDAEAVNFPPGSWRPLRLGEPVAEQLVVAFHAYLSTKRLIPGKSLSDIAEPTDPVEEDNRGIFGWKKGFIDLFPQLSRPTSVPDKAYCKDESDLLFAAEIILRSHALKAKGITSKDEAIAYSESIMKLPLAGFVDMLKMLWKQNANSVLFTINGSRTDLPERMAITVAAPVGSDYYFRRRQGDVESITAADLREKSLYFWLVALGDHPEISVKKAPALRSLQTIRTLIFQASVMMPPLSEGGHTFHLLTQAVTSEAQSRATNHGWRDIRTLTHDTGVPQYEFAPPNFATHGAGTPAAMKGYEALRSLMSGVQADIRFQEWLDSGPG